MADSVADRVREQVSGFGGGTGVVTLTGTPVAGFQSFLSGWGASGTGDYCLVMGSQWEVGFGTLNAGGTTLTRTTPYGSYSGGTFTAGAACNFSAGTLDCFGDIPAELAHYLNMREFAVAAASPTDIGAVMGSCININGSSTTISSFGTKKNRRRFVRMGTAQTITHNASSLICPGAVSIAAAAGDTFIAQSDSSGNWRITSYQRANGLGGPLTLSRGVALSGTDVRLASYQLQAHRSAAQSFTAAVKTKIQFDAEDFDPSNWYDNATNFRYTPLVAGKYSVTVGVSVTQASGGGFILAMIYKNGTEYAENLTLGNATNGCAMVNAIVDMNGTTDFIEGWGRGSGVTPSFDGGASPFFTWMSISYTGP